MSGPPVVIAVWCALAMTASTVGAQPLKHVLRRERVPPTAAVATFGNSDLLDAGDQIFTIGAPHGANHSLAVGWISARREPAKTSCSIPLARRSPQPSCS